jgi:sulfate adenylyltransferase
MIRPHGGKLIDRMVPVEERPGLLEEAARLPQVVLNERETADLELLACGAMSPLAGFMTEADYRGAVDGMHLAHGQAWSIPVVLSAKTMEPSFGPGERVALVDPTGAIAAVMDITDCYQGPRARGAAGPAHHG